MTTIDRSLHKNADGTEARLAALDARLAENPADEAALIERGRLRWALGMRKDAIGDYLAAQRINPRGAASHLLEAANSILDFYHRDLFNP